MAEFNGKQGRWITYEGRHLFIEDGKDIKDAIKAASGKKQEDLIDKQEREIAERARQAKELNDEKKYNEQQMTNKSQAPKLKSDIGNRAAKSYDLVKQDFQDIVDYLRSNPEKKTEFLRMLKSYPYVNTELMIDVEYALKKNNPKMIFDSKGSLNFLRAYLHYTEPKLSKEEIEDRVLSDLIKKHRLEF